MGSQGLIQHDSRPKREDPAVDLNLLAVVVDVRQDGDYIVKPRGRRHNAFLSGHHVFNAFQQHDLKFGDLVVVDVGRDAQGRDNVTALRGASQEEYDAR
jgi:hypothetical protein